MTQNHGTGRAEKVAALTAQLDEQLTELVTGEDWTRALAMQAKFHSYSANNVFLILIQRPDATRVAGYRRWQSLGRQVRKGEKGIAILAPCVYTKTDEATGEKVRRLGGFRVEHVFDLSQTDGEPLDEPVRPVLLAGEAPAGLWDALAAQVEGAGYTVERGDCGGANGRTSPADRTVRVRADVDDAQAAKTLAHELAHVLLVDHHNPLTYLSCRGRCEVEAESVAYVVSQANGLATGSYTLPYVASWASGDLAVIRATFDRVGRTARQILDAMATAAEEVAA